MEKKVDQLHSQLHYWQNVTVNILKDHYASLNTGKERTTQTNVLGVGMNFVKFQLVSAAV